MKNVIYISLIAIVLFACKKTEFSPEGPTDVRVRNLQGDLTFLDIIVNTSGGMDTTGNIKKLGTVNPGDVSEYSRFTKAFPKAEITAKINGETFSTGPVNSTYMQYIGQDRITYEVYISNMPNKVLKINNVVVDEPLILK
jgi:hypothetical protein